MKILMILLFLSLLSCGNLENVKDKEYTISTILISSNKTTLIYFFNTSFTSYETDIKSDLKVGDKVKIVMVKVE